MPAPTLTPARAAAPGSPRTARLRNRVDRTVVPLLFVAPFFVLFGVFGLFPLLYTGWVSLHDWQLINGDEGFVGLTNYTALLADPDFWNALANTLGILVLSTVPELLAALGVATLLNRPLRGATAWRVGVLLPNVVSVVAVALIFGQLYGADYGLVNGFLGLFGIDPISWQGNGFSAQLAIASMVAWRWTGYNALIYLAAMQAVPRELYEVAAIDGASRLRTFVSVTLPAIRPTLLFTVVAATIGGFQLFAEPQLFDVSGTSGTGGDDRQFQTLVMYLYENGFGKLDAGYAAAIAWLTFLLCAGFAVVNVRLVRRAVGRD